LLKEALCIDTSSKLHVFRSWRLTANMDDPVRTPSLDYALNGPFQGYFHCVKKVKFSQGYPRSHCLATVLPFSPCIWFLHTVPFCISGGVSNQHSDKARLGHHGLIRDRILFSLSHLFSDPHWRLSFVSVQIPRRFHFAPACS
jgi:hypothetical protein